MSNASPIAEYRNTQSPRMSMAAFGKLFDPPVRASAVCRWEKGINLTPQRAVEIEKLTGISRRHFFPELFEASE